MSLVLAIVSRLTELRWLTATLLTIICSFIIIFAVRIKRNTRIPGPIGIPILGNLLQLGKAPHIKLTKYWRSFGNVFQIQLGSRPTIVLNGAETIRKALVSQADEFAGRPDFYSFKFIANGNSMGFGNFTPRWKMHRKITQNALALFSSNQSNPIEVNIQKEADLLVSNLIKCSENEGANGINPHDEIYLSVGNIICAICFGKRYKRDDPDFIQLVQMNDEFMSFAGAGNPVDIMPWMRHFTKGSFKKFLHILDVMDNFCKRKREEHLVTYDPTNIRDVTDALIKTSHEIADEQKQSLGLSDEHILCTVQEMIGAGFDTISTTLLWAVLFMASHPQYQQRVHEEIIRVVGKRTIKTSDIGNLPFAEACIYEIMRHSCIFPFALPHSTTKDTILGGHAIPANTLIFVNMWSLSRDEEIFPEAEIFNPYRFLSEDGLGIDKSKLDKKFFPYGCGRRRCPGEQLARQEVFIFFTTLMQRCQVEEVPGEKLTIESKYGLTLKPKDFHVIVKKMQDE